MAEDSRILGARRRTENGCNPNQEDRLAERHGLLEDGTPVRVPWLLAHGGHANHLLSQLHDVSSSEQTRIYTFW